MSVSYFAKAFSGIPANIYLLRVNKRNHENFFMQLSEMDDVGRVKIPQYQENFFPQITFSLKKKKNFTSV